jgi:hypothetical protein
MEYRESDLPVILKETEYVILSDGTQVRFEESGGARDIMINDEWTPRATIFPDNEYILETGAGTYRLTAGFLDLKVEKI